MGLEIKIKAIAFKLTYHVRTWLISLMEDSLRLRGGRGGGKNGGGVVAGGREGGNVGGATPGDTDPDEGENWPVLPLFDDTPGLCWPELKFDDAEKRYKMDQTKWIKMKNKRSYRDRNKERYWSTNAKDGINLPKIFKLQQLYAFLLEVHHSCYGDWWRIRW